MTIWFWRCFWVWFFSNVFVMHFFALFMYMLVLVMHLNTFGTVTDTLQHKSCWVPPEFQFWDSRVSILRLGWYGENCTIMCLHGPDKSIIYAFLPFLCICWCLLCMWTLLVLLWTLYNTNIAESHPSLTRVSPESQFWDSGGTAKTAKKYSVSKNYF